MVTRAHFLFPRFEVLMKERESTASQPGQLGRALGRRLVRFMLSSIGPALRLLALGIAVVAVLLYRTPMLGAVRAWVIVALLVVILVGALVEGAATVRTLRRRRWGGVSLAATLAVFWGAALAVIIGSELDHRAARRSVFSAPVEARAVVGERFIIGYRDFKEVRMLVEHDAIAGVHVTRRNLSVGVDGLRDEIAALQAIRAARGRPPLLIAADHEGGVVSHLAPPLNKLPGLGVVGARSEGEREAAARDHARVQGADLRRLGVNLNFAPVVDLRLVEIDRLLDRFSRIDARAISHTPTVIEAVASWYCEELRTFRVACTLKHFPGLGRVREDTHFVAGKIDAAVELLTAEDWVPFRTVASGGGPSTLIMVAHAIVPTIDRDRPASRSRALIGGVIRESWAHQGVLVTDDLSMLPISRGPGGVGGASLDAVKAGVDYLLIAYDPDLFYEAAAALLRRWHELPPEVEAASIPRRARLTGWLSSD